jgi:hypothetical protein
MTCLHPAHLFRPWSRCWINKQEYRLLRVLHLLPHLSGGGTEQQFGYLAPELVHRGHRVDVGYLSNGPSRPELTGVTRHHLVSLNNYDPYLLWQLVRLMRRVKPDIVATWILQMENFLVEWRQGSMDGLGYFVSRVRLRPIRRLGRIVCEFG